VVVAKNATAPRGRCTLTTHVKTECGARTKLMTMTYTQLTSLNDSLDKELDDTYQYCEMVQDMNHELTMQNIQLNVLINSLNKKIKKGYLQ